MTDTREKCSSCGQVLPPKTYTLTIENQPINITTTAAVNMDHLQAAIDGSPVKLEEVDAFKCSRCLSIFTGIKPKSHVCLNGIVIKHA